MPDPDSPLPSALPPTGPLVDTDHPLPPGDPADPADLTTPAHPAVPGRRALVGGAVGLGVLGLAVSARSSAAARPTAPSGAPSTAPGQTTVTSAAPTPGVARLIPTTTSDPAALAPSAPTGHPATRRARGRSGASPSAARPEPASAPTPATSTTTATSSTPATSLDAPSAPLDAPPARTAARAAPRLAATRVAQEQAAAAATEAARTSGLRVAARVAASPRVVTTAVAGTSTPVAHDAPPTRVSVPAGFSAGYASVAATTRPTRPGIFTPDPVLHLARRATFGPRPADLVDIRTLGIDGWLARQLAPETIPDSAADEAWALFPLAGAAPSAIQAGLPLYSWDAEWMTAQATLARQILSQRQLYEQVVDVMHNHLHVAVPCEAWDTAPSYVMEVIRPHAMGRYRDMLLAAMRHPAMLQYLNNDVSSKTLVNENLGRELLELHTVGFGAGYTEAEVVASAKVLTGRMVSNGRFVYRPDYHWTGPLSVMGWSSANQTAAGGLDVGDAYLTYLAGHPSTARTIARKLAVRFVSDQPPAALVDRMAAAYLANDTDLRAVLQCLFRSPEFWASTGQKARRPLEDVVGAARVLDMRPGPDTRAVIETLYWVVRSNGHAPLGWDPPNGYPDVAAAWSNAGSLVNRWTMHRALVNNWWQGMSVTPMLELVPLRDGLTAGQWVDELSLRLLGQTMTTARRDAVVAVANGLSPTGPAVNASWYAWTLIPLVLDSPYFQLR